MWSKIRPPCVRKGRNIIVLGQVGCNEGVGPPVTFMASEFEIHMKHQILDS